MKKLWIIALLAAGLAGCAESSDNNTDPKKDPVNPNPSASSCGNGLIELDKGEKCDNPNQDVECVLLDNSKIWEKGGKARCSADCLSLAQGTCVEHKVVAGVCGDGEINTGEKCDKDAGTSCEAYDPLKKWKEGGKAECQPDCKSLTVGTCVEEEAGQTCEDQGKVTCNGLCYDPCEDGSDRDEECKCPEPSDGSCDSHDDCSGDTPVCIQGECKASQCGDGVVYTPEVCEPNDGKTYTCADYNKDLEWEEGGVPTCAADCLSFEAGTCKEVVPETCGNKKADEGEACDNSTNVDNYTCEEFDKTKKWKEGGHAVCSDTCHLEQGTCVEAQEDPCGNGVKDEGEECDFGRNTSGKLITEMACGDYDPEFQTGNSTKVKCTDSCKKVDTSACKASTKEDIYHCQLMEPVAIEFSDQLSEKTIVAHYAIGDNVDEDKFEAQVAVGPDFDNEMKNWKGLSTTVSRDKTKKELSAKLSVNDIDQSPTYYYTIRVRENASAEWKYCRKNEDNPSTVDGGISYCTTEGANDCNQHKVGIATVANVENIIAEFNFDDTNKYKGNDPTNSGNGFAADKGTGTIRVETSTNWKCSSTCFTGNEVGQSFSIGGCKKEKKGKDGAIDNDNNAVGNHILIKGLNSMGVNNVDLAMSIKRNNTSSSPTNVVVRVSTDSYQWERDIALDDKDDKFHVITPTALHSSAGNKSSFDIQIIPYGSGTGVLKFDNIIISKGAAE